MSQNHDYNMLLVCEVAATVKNECIILYLDP